MSEDVSSDGGAGRSDEPGRRRPSYWWRRRSVRQLRREAETARPYSLQWDERDNIESRLPDGESVELGGLALAEVFAPSTVGQLFTALDEWQTRNPYDSHDRVLDLKRSRTSTGGGWSRLGMVRRPGKFVLGSFGVTDPTLPSGVDAAWLSVSYVTASVAVVTATFAMESGTVDMGAELAIDRRRTMTDVKVVIPGRLGRLRARIPWSRPKKYGTTSSMNDVWRLKEESIELKIRELEEQCEIWFYGQFRGRFSQLSRDRRPRVRIIFSEQAPPFGSNGRRSPLTAAGLGDSFGVYKGSESGNAGWCLSTRIPFRSDKENVWTFAARRSDVLVEVSKDKLEGSNWSIVQAFAGDHIQLLALHALQVMLQTYGDDLAQLRDRADRSKPFARPVREARLMNTYLLTTGLDVSTVTSDITMITKSLTTFRWQVPEYHQDAGNQADHERYSLVPAMRRSLRWQAKRLARSSIDTDHNLRASAELQQAIANTRMQRVVLLLSVVAVVVSVVALLVGQNASH